MEPLEFLEDAYNRWDAVASELDNKISSANGNAKLITQDLVDEYTLALATRRRIGNAIECIRLSITKPEELLPENLDG